jgi:hypothetical protein
LESVKRPKKVLRIAALAMLLLGALGITIQFVLALVTQNNGLSLVFFAFSLVFILLGFGLTVFYLRKIDGWEKAVLNSEERNAIISEYTDRFQNSIRGLTDLKAHLESIREENIKVKAIPGLLNEEEKSKQALILKIDRKMSEFGLNGVSQEDWENCLQEIKQSQSDIKSNIEKNKIDLARLNIQEEDYLVNPVEEEFNHDKLSKLSNKRKLTLEKVAEIEKGLEKLKASVCQETGDQLNTGWVEVLDKIQLKRERLLEDYKNTTAKIVGEIATKEVLLKLQKEEDEKIRKGIQTKELKNILSRITENYEAIDFNGDEVIVKGKYGDFSLSNISTGTREQILLALRMGFASKLAGGNPLFLILDDAFQHSDWNRREHLFDAVFRLVETGWQITYLTMSDHIRDRMKELGDERLGSEFRFHTLAQ